MPLIRDLAFERSGSSGRRLGILVSAALACLIQIQPSVQIFGVTTRRVARSARETGIRMALGASRAEVVWTVVSRTTTPGLAGIALGLALALGLRSSLASFLFHVGAADPVSYLGATFLLAGVLLTAALLPARSVAGAAPMEVLREE